MTQDNTNFHSYWSNRGHHFGECMSASDADWMYVKIPKNASIWTREILLDNKFEFYQYHKVNFYHKHALVILRDPMERWLSGVAEYFTRYHKDIDLNDARRPFYELVLDMVTLDDHTEKQIYFIDGLDPNNCTFLYCDKDLPVNFAGWMQEKQGIENHYETKNPRNVGDQSSTRKMFRLYFNQFMNNKQYVDHIKAHYQADYDLINSVEFWRKK